MPNYHIDNQQRIEQRVEISDMIGNPPSWLMRSGITMVAIVTVTIAHFLLGVSPFAFGKQFLAFSKTLFFKISEGLFEFPLLNGTMNYENFASFWFVYFGLLIIPIGILVDYIEKTNKIVPKKFIIAYLVVVLIGVYMIPFSGMTFLMLPHAIYMFIQRNNQLNNGKI